MNWRSKKNIRLVVRQVGEFLTFFGVGWAIYPPHTFSTFIPLMIGLILWGVAEWK